MKSELEAEKSGWFCIFYDYNYCY